MRADLWSAEDEAILRRLYPDTGARGVQPLLSRHRALSSIMDKAAKMQVHRIGRADSQPRQDWVNGRRAELERLAGLDLSAADIAVQLGVTKNSVIGALSRNDEIYWPGRRKHWNCAVVTTLYDRLPEIDTDSCRWLDGEPREFRYCGKPIARMPNSRHGESYCAEHRAIVWDGSPQGRQPDFPGRAKW